MAKGKLNKETSEFLVNITAKKEEWAEVQKHAFKHIAKNIEVKGFRKGRVPETVLKSKISNEEVMSHAIKDIVKKLGESASKEVPEDVMILDGPTYKVEKLSDVELEIQFIYPVYPEFDLPDYKKLGVKFEKPKFDPKIINKEIERIQSSQATHEEKNGPIAKGDTATFDYSGSVDGTKFEGGTAEGHTMEIGSGQFIPGFEDQMEGMKKGDKKDIKVTFPKDYNSDELKGKEAIFKVEVKEVKTKKLPEINDDFAKSIGAPGVSTVDELKKYIEKVFKEQKLQQARASFQREAFEKMATSTKIILPLQLVGREMQNQENQFTEQMKQQGLTMEEYIKMTGMKEEVLRSQFKAAAEKRLVESLLFVEIAKVEKIELKDEDYEKEYEKLSKVYGETTEAIKGMITKQQMQIPMTNDKVIDTLIKYNK